MKLKGLILYLGIGILAILINIRFNLSTIEFIFWIIAMTFIYIGTNWED